METTEIIRILRKCGECCLTDCTECPEYKKAEVDLEARGLMWSCGGVLLEAADRLALMEDIRKDMMDRTNENHQLKRQLKCARAERDAIREKLIHTREEVMDLRKDIEVLSEELTAAREKLSWQEPKPAPNDWGEYPPEFPREGM